MNTGSASAAVTGSLRSAGSKAVIYIEGRLDAPADDVWTALTETPRLAAWYGDVEGELRVGGRYHARVHASGWEGDGVVLECEPLASFKTSSKDPEEPNEDSLTVTLRSEGDQTLIVVEQVGPPLDLAWAYGAGMQIHVEDLAAYLAGRDRCDAQSRFGELEPVYRKLAVDLA
jgi:uncharacterized protein YndB with AHSA1/START domain